ncbi:MAG: prepilin-type N-terminal cleavage/methylation domain-containing protein [Leptolyngbya sp. PLA3]|nr:MAG: prepilin-type N-terminal cleavage/methylation domain-containing protein [Cyanobacteria bacterium CYA]MCE7969805.1 prepilin-type N-terminal cleavage/methylation domain-containing protein [Leptolyngbya sp. PL-A3]
MQMTQKNRRTGFTLIELLVVIAIIALLIGILLPALSKARKTAQQLKDSTQIRNILQAMAVFANQNRDSYPLPSRLDKGNKTINAAAGQESIKDTTRNIFSILVFDGSIPTEMCIGTTEPNGQFEVYKDYELSEPEGAVDPDFALWDPKFSANPADASSATAVANQNPQGNFSYAHTLPFGKRKSLWSNDFSATQAMLSNRGPEYDLNGSGQDGTWQLVEGTYGEQSNTLLIHGGRSKWEGLIGYNDAHVDFSPEASPEKLIFTFTGLTQQYRTQPDNIFVCEDDALRTEAPDNMRLNQRNAWLRQVSNITVSGANTTVTIFQD